MKPKTLKTINKKQTFVVTGGREFLWQVFGLKFCRRTSLDKCIVAKGVKTSTGQFFPPKN